MGRKSDVHYLFCNFRATTCSRPGVPAALLRNASVKLQHLQPPGPAARALPVHRETNPAYETQRSLLILLCCRLDQRVCYDITNSSVLLRW